MLIQLQFIYKYKLKLLRWYTGTLSHNSARLYPILAIININLYLGGTLVEWHTDLMLCTLCFPINYNLY
jgi:hypothetical protein